MKIIIAYDHAGFMIKQKLIEYLGSNGYEVEDLGPNEYNIEDDYPDFVVPAMKSLQSSPDSLGILLCRNGVGVSILANKYKGIRTALCFDKKQAKKAKTDDNANVIALPTDYLSDNKTLNLVKTFIKTPFSQQERHQRRLEKIEKVEEENFKQ